MYSGRVMTLHQAIPKNNFLQNNKKLLLRAPVELEQIFFS